MFLSNIEINIFDSNAGSTGRRRGRGRRAGPTQRSPPLDGWPSTTPSPQPSSASRTPPYGTYQSTGKDTPQPTYTLIRFVSFSAQFGTCNVVGLNGTLDEAKMFTSFNVRVLSWTSVPFRPATVQMPNLLLTETKIDYSVDACMDACNFTVS